MLGVVVAPGHIVVADTDGVRVLPLDKLTRTVEAAKAREEKEARFMEELANGSGGGLGMSREERLRAATRASPA